MKAKTVRQIMESYEEEQGELRVTAGDTMDELIHMVLTIDNMLKLHRDALPHPARLYKRARAKALEYLKKKYHLSRKEIQNALTEAETGINESFNAVIWSKKHLPEEIAEHIEQSMNGDFGETFQKGVLKANNKQELLDWYNKNFEVGEI